MIYLLLGLRQKKKHLRIAVPLVNAALDKYKIEGESVRTRCQRDSYEDRRTSVLICVCFSISTDAFTWTGAKMRMVCCATLCLC